MQKPEVFAKAVVRHILASSPNPWVYKGNVATIAWIVSTFGPNWAFVSSAIQNIYLSQGAKYCVPGFTDEEYVWTGKVSKRDSKSGLSLVLIIRQLSLEKKTS